MKSLRLTRAFVLTAALFAMAVILYFFHQLHWMALLLMPAPHWTGLALGVTNIPTGASQGPDTAANGFNADNCSPRFLGFDDPMSLTRVNITGWNKSDIESQMFKEVGLDKIIAQTKEARIAGTKQRTLTDLLLSRNVPLKMGGGVNAQSVIQPFRLVPRRNRVNPGYFRISAGAVTGAAAFATTNYQNGAGVAVPTGVTALWSVIVNNGSIDADSSPFMKSPNNALKNIERYFLPRHNVTVEYVTSANVKVAAVMKIIASFNIDSNQACVVLAPNLTYKGDSQVYNPTAAGSPVGGQASPLGGMLGNATNGGWEALAAAAQAVYQPTIGIVRIQVNSVSDFEQYGIQLPGYNDLGLIEYWRQTFRRVHKYNDEYAKGLLAAATTSDGLKKFRLLPLAKLLAQQEKFFEDMLYETVFYGQQLSEQQTTTTWNNLPTVNDPAWAESGESGTLPIEYLSNTIGIRQQIAACGNVLDQGGAPLDLDAILEAGYYIKREREGETGADVTDIDCMTDGRFTRTIMRQLMPRYFKAKNGLDSLTGYIQLDNKIGVDGKTYASTEYCKVGVMFTYDSYSLPEYGYTLNVFSDPYFDDRIAQFQNSQKSAGRSIWFIDWSDIAINVMKSTSVMRTNNLLDNVYKYVIQQNVQHVMLQSRTIEVAVGDSNRHRIVENYSADCPKLTVAGCDLSQS
jgi:hypothetical protein